MMEGQQELVEYCKTTMGYGYVGFQDSLESNAFNAKLWRVFEGSKLARRQGYGHMEVQLDSQVVVDCLINSRDNNNMCALVQRIRDIIKEDWRVVIKHIYCEANKVAHGLASLACDTRVAYCLFEQAPHQ
ncbi:hypothetical protein L195_g030575, partial [Trifolium pratense]